MAIANIKGLIDVLRRDEQMHGGFPSMDSHFDEAVAWIERAHVAAGRNGISKGYHLIRNFWYPTYPETTGYTIPTLLNAAAVLDRPYLNDLALNLSDYLLGCTTPEGAITHWQDTKASQPVVFDTGQVVFGWLAAYEYSSQETFLDAARRAGDWLVNVQASSGSWQDFQHLGVQKTIDSRVDWSLLRLHQHTDNDAYLQAAVRNLEWVVDQQDVDGWFHNCAFLPNEDPITHTLAYTAEGLLECGSLLKEKRFRDASQLAADALLSKQRDDGALASTFGKGWHETSRSSCLTGNCQVAILWLRLYGLTGNEEYYRAASAAIAFVASTQNLSTSAKNIRGGIAGSYPVYGRYERFKYPNWATKFFIDALLAGQKNADNSRGVRYVG